MPRHYKCIDTIASVKYSLYICIISHMTGGRGHQRMECPFFVLQRRAERSGAAQEGSKVVLPPLFPLTKVRTHRNPTMLQTVERHPSATDPLRPR